MSRVSVLLAVLGVMVMFGIPVSGAESGVIITEDTILTSDVEGPVAFGADNVMLDCAGHSITGPSDWIGVDLQDHSGITVKNCVVQESFDALLVQGTGNEIINNTFLITDFGPSLGGSGNRFEGNVVTNFHDFPAVFYGVTVSGDGGHIVVGNEVVSQVEEDGIIVQSVGNTIANNLISGAEGVGIRATESWLLNTFENNTCLDNAKGPSDPIWVCEPNRDGPFTDDDNSVFQNAIEWIYWKGITVGCNPPANDEYCEGQDVTRGQLAIFISRAVPLYLADPTVDYFVDDDGTYWEGGANRLYEAGITVGCGGTNFCGDQPPPREQLAVFIARALNLPATPVDYFTDDEESPYEDAINRIAEAGITLGCNPPTNDHFCPSDTVTRGETAAFIKRAWGRSKSDR